MSRDVAWSAITAGRGCGNERSRVDRAGAGRTASYHTGSKSPACRRGRPAPACHWFADD
jgi:hypothetical protein